MDSKTKLLEALISIIKKNIGEENLKWLFDKATASQENNYQLNITFTSIPRRTGKKEVHLEEEDEEKLRLLLPGFEMEGWTIDRLCRVWLLAGLDSANRKEYINRIENLFPQGEMNELVALYSALPFLDYPNAWKLRCAEGIRSNIGDVLEAIMYHNPYPANHLDEAAWNQMVLKAFFTDKDVNKIVGLDKRANKNLANTLFDYAEERIAAGRTVNPQIWRLTRKFVDEPHLYLFKRLLESENEKEKISGALAIIESNSKEAKNLIDLYPGLKKLIEEKQINWQTL
ncbi:MAG: EboA domain-containing protein [Ginsengibacter sp.]